MDTVQIIERLVSFGFTANEEKDSWAISFLIDKVTSLIKNECNILEIPEELQKIAIDMVCGEFLQVKKSSGDIEGFEVDLNSIAIKQTQEGDTNVVFDVGAVKSAEQRLDALIMHLLNYGKPQLLKFRRFSW